MAGIKSLLKVDSLLKLPLSRKALIIAVVEVVIAGLFYQFLLGPRLTEIGALKERMNEFSVQLAENRNIAKDVPRYQMEKQELEGQLEKALTQLPNEKEIPSLIDSVSEAGRMSGLKILLFRPKPEVPRGFYAEVPVDMEVDGTYESLYEFCERVSKLPRIVNVEGINVTLADIKGFANLSPGLNAKFLAMTFRFIPEGEGAKEQGTK
ncbi:MAG: type 4a pilus biogenesis protein PilO [Deltaproteobacteria bacterium]|nr:type 4a pilus biogenesis protein PilO [Deltaproteobacteria bacterium]